MTSADGEGILPHTASAGLDADHQTPPGVHPGVGLPARRLDFGRIFTRAREVDPGFFDPSVGSETRRQAMSPQRNVSVGPLEPCRRGPREPWKAEGLRDGRYRPRVLALVEERYALPEPACRVGEPVEAFQGSL